MTYEELLRIADQEGIIVKEKPLLESDGRIYGYRIAIRKNIPTATEKACVLAEELGHHYTAVGNILDTSTAFGRKLEQAGRLFAYNCMIGLIGIANAYKSGCRNQYEMAEFLGVTEEFLKESLKCYRQKYGHYVLINNYIIYFEPYLAVIERTD